MAMLILAPIMIIKMLLQVIIINYGIIFHSKKAKYHYIKDFDLLLNILQ